MRMRSTLYSSLYAYLHLLAWTSIPCFEPNKNYTLSPRKNGKQMYPSNLGTIFNILPIWGKSVFSTIFVPVLRVFSRFTCKNGGFWVFSINIGHIHGRKKTTSTWHLILKILQWFSFDLKTPNPMLNRLQYMQYSHYLIKTIHHESWYCKIMKNKMKILSCQK